jgi:uncharacterized protein YjbJ (UPF0337 family)
VVTFRHEPIVNNGSKALGWYAICSLMNGIVNNGLRNAWLVLRFGLAQILNGFDASAPIRLGGSMKPSTKDQIEGKLHEVKGAVKEKAGQAANNPNLAAEGQAEKIAGKVQKKVGQIEKVFEK